MFYAPTRWSLRFKSHPGRLPTPSVQAREAERDAEIATLKSRLALVEAHAALAYSEIHNLKRQLNAHNNKGSKRRKLNVEARWLNSDEGLRMAEEAEALKAAEEQRKREAQEQRAAKEAEREEQRRQRDPNEPFTGALASKTKPDLQDVAQALGLAIDGQKKDLLARINTHFDANPLLREDPRFEGIFNRSRRRPTVQNDENHPPASSGAPGPTAHPYFGTAPLATNIVNSLPSTSMPPVASSSMLPPPWPIHSYLPFVMPPPPHNFGPPYTFDNH